MTTSSLVRISDAELLESTRAFVRSSNVLEANLVEHLAEIEERRLHLEQAFPSMFEFCTRELGMSEAVALNRIYVARLTRRLPGVLDWIRSGRIHLSGMRELAPHLTESNCAELLAEATGKSKREIERLVTRFAPKPPVAASIRKTPVRTVGASPAHPPIGTNAPTAVAAPSPAAPESSTQANIASRLAMPVPETPQPAMFELTSQGHSQSHSASRSRRHSVEPLTPETYKLTLPIDGALLEKVKQAQDLMRHRVGDGDLVAIFEAALDVLIETVKKERFGVGRTPRKAPATAPTIESSEPAAPATRHIPDPVKRAVYERDGGRCTWVSPDGRRCTATGCLEFDHLDGFAITGVHSVERVALRCRAHNQFAAEKLYGRAKMARMKNSSSVTCPGTSDLGLFAASSSLRSRATDPSPERSA